MMIIVTMGDPNGIGPELICRVFSNYTPGKGSFLLIGPSCVLDYYCNKFSIKKFWKHIEKVEDIVPGEHKIFLYSKGLEDFDPTPGCPSPSSGYISGKILQIACEFLRKNIAHSVVTCPIDKRSLMEGGFDFPGHTEFLAREFGLSPDDVCMHLMGDSLRVSLVTTHLPLRDVPYLISKEKIVRCILLTYNMLKKLYKDKEIKPIGVCGLNPHAGEYGKIGSEEIEIISPSINIAQKKGIDVKGPYPADTLFYRAYNGEFSAVVAMYHDQALGPLKLIHFGEAVNVTLGLPIVRTSVDHGTGYDLVGKKIAKTSSLLKAIDMAYRLS